MHKLAVSRQTAQYIDQSPDPDHQSGSSRVTSAPSQSLLKRPAMEAPDQTPPKKLAKCTSQDNSARRVTFTSDTKQPDGGRKVPRENPSPLHRMINLGLDNSIPLSHLNRACQELLSSFSDPESLLLLGLYARGREADSEVINSIEEKLAVVLCSDFLLDIQPVCSYKDARHLQQHFKSTKAESLKKKALDKVGADCLSALRSAIFNRVTVNNLSYVFTRYKHCSLSKVHKLYSGYRTESLKNGIAGFALANSSVNDFFRRLVTIIPDDVLVSKYLEGLER